MFYDPFYIYERYPFLLKEKSVSKPELKRKTEQGRNEKCSCKSGKKYKNCCGI